MNDEKKMYNGSWSCGSCGGAITELPFEPDPARASNLLCRDCHQKQRDERPRQEKAMHEGNWSCADCNGAITSLPFEPRDTSTLKCKDCFRK